MSKTPDMPRSEATPESVYRNRRFFLKTSIWAGTSLATYGLYRQFRPQPEIVNTGGKIDTAETTKFVDGLPADERINTFGEIAGYNNYYEFSTDKSEVAGRAKDFITDPWSVQVGGLVKQPRNFSMADLFDFEQEERTYRFRCVEGWSMVIPWVGFPLAKLLDVVEPLENATHVAFETYYDLKQMPNSVHAGIDLPYVEGLRLDEAKHPLTLLATGLYGKTLPNQNGAPIRLVVPWKYGFKSIKSLVKITLTDFEPPTTWNLANSREYGFYSNVNPHVDHPRWSQARERRIGEGGTRETLMFNGYEDQVAHLYQGMDLRKNY
ncbi:protein-methionine-sulfoxide reductase catalytic subunit MsrP [Luteolibacter pohnpeiensis]|uniref:Protein-methionine-sulfoxide reductase catalytic subunit MsrP n=1 Tax=Luteolibacter pohnpeiensis TaxID=454153 RepID=A0A934SBH0_9BACT|nr:protein-methionine-sulfoxide reductase catalytic subunit MsrP [Luteolibacter pohnpeiensis]MBK1882243.1 protein-methionine-sulfoxide reductase catalytic subunit MsrP [Luteolibacter pohnpeiensis]